MERLTDIEVIAGQVHPIPKLELQNPSGLEKIVSRLQEIEDILGDTYDLDRLREAMAEIAGAVKKVSAERAAELVEADKDGRCVVLPCKTVFEPTWDAGPDCDGNCPHCFEPERCDICAKGKLFIYERICTQEHISRFGKTVFRTRQEAEAAIKEDNENENVQGV